jgi:hypothetical protein
LLPPACIAIFFFLAAGFLAAGFLAAVFFFGGMVSVGWWVGCCWWFAWDATHGRNRRQLKLNCRYSSNSSTIRPLYFISTLCDCPTKRQKALTFEPRTQRMSLRALRQRCSTAALPTCAPVEPPAEVVGYTLRRPSTTPQPQPYG